VAEALVVDDADADGDQDSRQYCVRNLPDQRTEPEEHGEEESPCDHTREG